jgi:DNA-binding transcriptional ArsR family regulator
MQIRFQDATLEPDFDALARLCGAASSPQRLRLLYAIARGVTTVSELAKWVGLTTTAVSAHLGELRSLGLVQSRRIHPHHEWRLALEHPNFQRLQLALPEIFGSLH